MTLSQSIISIRKREGQTRLVGISMKIYREPVKSARRDLEIPYEVHFHDLRYGGATYDYICDEPLQDARLRDR